MTIEKTNNCKYVMEISVNFLKTVVEKNSFIWYTSKIVYIRIRVLHAPESIKLKIMLLSGIFISKWKSMGVVWLKS